MTIRERILSWLERFAIGNWTAQRLAISFCVGTYIAFSPFPGFHTWMSLLFACVFSLNVAVVFAASIFINNPWSMFPIYGADYFLGDFLLKFIMTDTCSLDPLWMCKVNTFLFTYTGIEHISLWSFVVGGNILGITVAFAVYPLVKSAFTMILKKKQNGAAS